MNDEMVLVPKAALAAVLEAHATHDYQGGEEDYCPNCGGQLSHERLVAVPVEDGMVEVQRLSAQDYHTPECPVLILKAAL